MFSSTAKCIDNSSYPNLTLNETYNVSIQTNHVQVEMEDGIHYYPIEVFDIKKEIKVTENDILVLGEKKFYYDKVHNTWLEI